MSPELSAHQSSFESLQRQLFLVTVALLSVAGLIVTAFAYPPGSALFALSAVVTLGWALGGLLYWAGRLGTRVVGRVVAGLGALLFLGLLLADLLGLPESRPLVMLGAAQLAYMWLFMALGARRGLRGGLAIYSAALLMASVAYLLAFARGELGHLARSWELHVFYFLLCPLTMGLLLAMTRLRVHIADQRILALNHAVYTDTLTHLPNRVAFQNMLLRALQEAGRTRRPGTLALLNINQFVRLNDELGHAAGDLALSKLARRFQARLPQEAQLARISGDEFALILPGITGAAAEAQMRQLIEAAQEPLDLGGIFRSVRLRCGLAHFPQNGNDPTALNTATALAALDARRTGQALAVYSPQMALSAERRRRVISALELAPQRGELALAFQPICSLQTGQVASVEVLLRWNSDIRPPPNPEEFISLAEEAGLIERLGEWVLHAALEQLREWRELGLNIPRINVNVSPQEIMHGQYAHRTLQKLSELGLPPGMLELELTERTVLQESALLQLRVLRSAGVHISIDDFGTGHSSLGRLHSLPITGVKLDRSFTTMLGQDASADRLSRTVLTLARSLELEVVAEGIETPAQLEILRELACPLGQGYLFTRPLTAAGLMAYLSKQGVGAVA